MGRRHFEAGMMIAILVAASDCIMIPVPLAADPIETRGTVSCEEGNPFARDTSQKKLAAIFGASNVQYLEEPADEGDSEVTLLYPRDPEGWGFWIKWKDNKRRSRPKEITILSSKWLVGRELRVGMSLQQVQALNGRPFRVDESASFEEPRSVTDWRGGALERLGGCRLGVTFQNNSEENSVENQEDYETLRGVMSDDPRLRPFSPIVSYIYVFYK